MTGPATQPNLKVLRQLSSDAQSEAFLAMVGGFDSPMVVRLLKPELAQDLERVQRFLAAAQRLAGVSSPGLVQVRQSGRMSDGRVYVLTDFAEGESLEGKPPLQLEALVELGEKLGEALKALHDAGLVTGPVSAKQVVLTATGPRLDVSLAALSRDPASTAVADVQGLATLLQTFAAAGAKNSFEVALRASLSAATTAVELTGAFGAVRSRWGGDTKVSLKKEVTAPVVAEPPEPDLTGKTLGPYQLLRMLGEGAMGRVYLGKHNRIGREAAIKVLRSDHAKDKDLVQRFIQEATAVSAIKNEHIVEVHDFGEEVTPDGSPHVYCVMEVLHGRDLADELKKGRLAVQRACRIAQQVAQALGSAHALGVVHRDVKPENIFLHQKGADPDFVKVLDFGVAKLLKPMGGLPTSSTQAGMIIGTPDYMAPEQAMGISTDLRVDLYAVGLVLYELLAGQRPFRGDTFGQLVVEITTRPPPPLPARTLTGEVMPPRLLEVIAKCLEKKPEDRWSSAAELCAALEPFVHTGYTQTFPAVKPRSRAPVVWVAATIAVLLCGGAYWALRSDPKPAPVALVVAPVVVPPVVPEPPVVVAPVVPDPPVPPVAPIVEPPPAHAAAVKRIPKITQKEITQVFGGSQKKLQSCLSDHVKLLPSKAGELTLSFTVLASGAVTKAEVTSPGFEGVVGDCVAKRLKTLRFPANLEPEVTFTMPLKYVFKD